MARLSSAQIRQRGALRAQGLKQCGHCKRILSLTDFGKCAPRWDGLQALCRTCANAAVAAAVKRVDDRMGHRAWLDRQNRWAKGWRTRKIARIGAPAFWRPYALRRYGITVAEYDATS